MSTDNHPLTVVQGPQTLDEFMAQALAMEQDAAERYTEFADTLEQHNNHEVATLFRTMAEHEASMRAASWPRWAGGKRRRCLRTHRTGPAANPPKPRPSTKCTT